jgi:hypothetical protein
MAEHRLEPGGERPYFAEVPYSIWGEVNYDSEGDCNSPRDRSWKELYLENRVTRERVSITIEDGAWLVEGDEPAASRASLFLAHRCGARALSGQAPAASADWNHDAALKRAAEVAAEFEHPDLAIFDSHLFWGSWKWIGWFATEFTWVGRWIMHSVVRRDTRAVNLCIDWLKSGTFNADQSAALRGALGILTGHHCASDDEWILWYEGSAGAPGHREKYPEPDFDRWLEDIKADRRA